MKGELRASRNPIGSARAHRDVSIAAMDCDVVLDRLADFMTKEAVACGIVPEAIFGVGIATAQTRERP